MYFWEKESELPFYKHLETFYDVCVHSTVEGEADECSNCQDEALSRQSRHL